MIAEFADWQTKTITIKELTTTVDGDGVPQEGESVVASDLKVNYWTDVTRETNQNDRFVDQALGTILLDPGVSVSTAMWFELDGVKHYITGVDDVAGMGEFTVVSWRREYGS